MKHTEMHRHEKPFRVPGTFPERGTRPPATPRTHHLTPLTQQTQTTPNITKNTETKNRSARSRNVPGTRDKGLASVPKTPPVPFRERGVGNAPPAPTRNHPQTTPKTAQPSRHQHHTTTYAGHTMTQRPGSTRSDRKLRVEILDRDNWRCRWCGRPIHNRADCTRGGCRDDATIDHLRHWRDGGQSTPDNLIAACRWCNLSRGVGDRPRPRPGTQRLMAGVTVL